MKRYSHFLRSGATVSLSILYLATSLFSYTFVNAEEAVQEVQIIEESSNISKSSEFSSQDSEVVFSEKSVDPHEKTISEKIEGVQVDSETEEISNQTPVQETDKKITEENFLVSTTSLVLGVCDVTNSPSVTFSKTYADVQMTDMNIEQSILSQLNPSAIDPEDGAIVVENDISTTSFSVGWNEINFTAIDSDGCVTEYSMDVFVVGTPYRPVCTSGVVYARITIPDGYTAALGTNTYVQSDEWFPIAVNGVVFAEHEASITVSNDIAITRVGSTLFINIGSSIPDGEIVAQDIVDSLTLMGGVIIPPSPYIFSGNVVIIDFQSEDCGVEVCSPSNGPIITSILTETVVIKEKTTLTSNEILDLFGILVEDQDGDGVVNVSSNLSSFTFTQEGTYVFMLTLTDNEGCIFSKNLTLLVDKEDDTPRGGGKKTGTNKNMPEGEVLGVATCEPYLRTFMQMGQQNLEEDVIKLQTFLNEYMGENLVVDGVYGPKTFEAVKRFQVQEFDEVLKPWYITEPTGIVRETTMRRINNIMCPELNIQMPILYCATTGNLIYPDGTVFDPDPEYILYNGKPVIIKKVILPDWILRKPGSSDVSNILQITQPNLSLELEQSD